MSHLVHLAGLPVLPPARDFILSPGFAGATALLAALIVLGAVMYGSRRTGKRHRAEQDQNERHHEERRADEQRAAAVARCWDRWWQVLETAALEPAASEGATLGLGPEVTLQVLKGLLRDAEQLGDDTLIQAITVYQEQFLLVLAQQSGPLSRLAAESTASTTRARSTAPPPREAAALATDGAAPQRNSNAASTLQAATPSASREPDGAETAAPAAAEPTTGRRRRR